MTKFKAGDVVERVGHSFREVKVGDICIVDYLSMHGLHLVGLPGCYDEGLFNLVVDEALLPAPKSVMYFNSHAQPGNDQRLEVSQEFFDTSENGISINIVPRGKPDGVAVGLYPDDAIQLGYDIIRMARTAKKAQG